MQLKRLPQQGGINVALPILPAANFTAAAPWTAIIPIDRDMYLWGLELHLKFRVAIGAFVIVNNAENPFNFIRAVRVSYNHDIFGAKTIINLRGATLYRRAHMFYGVPPTAATPIGPGIANWDVILHYSIPFVLESVDESEQWQTLLDAPRCSSLQLEIDFAAGRDYGVPAGATTYVFTQFGGAAGTPELRVTKLIPLGLKGSPYTARVEKVDVMNAIALAQTEQQRIGNEIPTGNTVRMLLLKQYTQDAGVAAPCAVAMTAPVLVAAPGMTSIRLLKDDTPIRSWDLWHDAEEECQLAKHLAAWPPGYVLIDFAEFGTLRDALLTQDYPANKSRLEFKGLINALATNSVDFGIDQVFANPNK
jgi:hypothetical protein